MTSEVFIKQAKDYSSIGKLEITHNTDIETIRLKVKTDINGYRAGLEMSLTAETLKYLTPESTNILLGQFYKNLLRYCLDKTNKPHFQHSLIGVSTSIAGERDE